MMPDEKLIDPVRAARSLCRLREVFPLNLLVGDGAPIFGRAYEAINACLERRSEAKVNRVNLDELPLRTETGPANYTVELAEIGFRIGAENSAIGRRALGRAASSARRTGTRPKRSSLSSGRVRRRSSTPHGSMPLRPGDFVAFPTREFGAHKLVNHSDAPATVILISNVSPYDVCFYPDSKKLLVEATDTLVRSEPHPRLLRWRGLARRARGRRVPAVLSGLHEPDFPSGPCTMPVGPDLLVGTGYSVIFRSRDPADFCARYASKEDVLRIP